MSDRVYLEEGETAALVRAGCLVNAAFGPGWIAIENTPENADTLRALFKSRNSRALAADPAGAAARMIP